MVVEGLSSNGRCQDGIPLVDPVFLVVFSKETIRMPKRKGCNFWIKSKKYFEKSDKNGSEQPKILNHILIGVNEINQNDDGLF